jgi:hypothetical protein
MVGYRTVSMNLMHNDIRVTDSVYAPLASNEVQRRISDLTGRVTESGAVDSDLAAFIASLSDAELSQALVAMAELPEDRCQVLQGFGHGCLVTEANVGVVHVSHAAASDIEALPASLTYTCGSRSRCLPLC